jgi:hypothetical protein
MEKGQIIPAKRIKKIITTARNKGKIVVFQTDMFSDNLKIVSIKEKKEKEKNSLNVDETIKELEKLETVEEIEKAIEGEKRTTVLEAANLLIEELKK